MALNPFKESNLIDLRRTIKDYFKDHLGWLSLIIKEKWKQFLTKGRERITVMFIPHTEKKIVNFHISIFTISIIAGILIITVTITSIMIINHSSTIKEVSQLKKYGSNSKIKVKVYKEEINKLYSIFQTFKPEITHLYSLIPDTNIDTLWAKGGVPNPNPDMDKGNSGAGENSPPLEILSMQEIKDELKTTKEILEKIKGFIKYRKQIIENTPSIWPVDGYIISRYGNRSSPYNFRQEFHRGIDIEAFPSTEIRSTAHGNVQEIKWDPALGLTISIKHKYGFVTTYSHLQRVSVENGQKVSKGEVIGYVGKTGKTTKYICYYQVRIGTEFVDPMPYLNRISK